MFSDPLEEFPLKKRISGHGLETRQAFINE